MPNEKHGQFFARLWVEPHLRGAHGLLQAHTPPSPFRPQQPPTPRLPLPVSANRRLSRKSCPRPRPSPEPCAPPLALLPLQADTPVYLLNGTERAEAIAAVRNTSGTYWWWCGPCPGASTHIERFVGIDCSKPHARGWSECEACWAKFHACAPAPVVAPGRPIAERSLEWSLLSGSRD